MSYCPTCSGVLLSESADPIDRDQRPRLVCICCARESGRVGDLPFVPNDAALFASQRRVGRPRKVAVG